MLTVASPAKDGQRRILSIQVLRGLAALSVVLSHAYVRAELSYPELFEGEGQLLSQMLTKLGHSGVDLFFIISGFVMVSVHGDDFRRKGAFRTFMAKRLTRIVPIYWMLTTLALTILIARPSMFHYSRELDWAWIAASYSFIPWESANGLRLPLLSLGWTLNYEMYFYLIFSALLFLPKIFFLPLLGTYFVASIFLVGHFASDTSPFVEMVTSWLLLEFYAGCVIGFLWRKGIVMPSAVGRVFLCVFLVLMLVSLMYVEGGEIETHLRVTFWGSAFTFLLAAFTLTKLTFLSRPFPVLVYLGDASYSIYLVQVLALPAGALILAWAEVPETLTLIVGLLFLFSVCCGWGFFILFERPSTRFLKSLAVRKHERS
jgi:peptidoglycan/LPS O-acetylase OafA/YrhL